MQRRGSLNHAVLIHRKLLPMNQNAPRECAARGDEVYAEHTAREGADALKSELRSRASA